MTEYEKKTIAAFQLMWKRWGKMNETALQESIAALAANCNGFGSGIFPKLLMS